MNDRWPRHSPNSDWYNAPKTDGYEVVEADKDEESEAPVPGTDGTSTQSASVGNSEPLPPQGQRPATSQENGCDASQNGSSSLRSTRDMSIPLRRSSRSATQVSPTAVSKETPQSEVASPTVIPLTATGTLRQGETKASGGAIEIPKIPPINSVKTLPPNLAQLASGLEGKFVDEFGNILDWNGQVLGRVEGDLPSMIGRSVSSTGEILGMDGEVVGYVAENDTLPPAPPEPQPIEGHMGGGLKVDHMGNILDGRGNVIGHFNAAPLAPAMLPQAQHEIHEKTSSDTSQNAAVPTRACSCGRGKPSSTPSPSEVYLDVKSTNDGIQLIIKIPTIFNNGGRPTIHIG
jgi:Protein of unknown function (DUF3659)